jgi:hypothetical protein
VAEIGPNAGHAFPLQTFVVAMADNLRKKSINVKCRGKKIECKFFFRLLLRNVLLT